MKDLILLHGAIGSSAQLAELRDTLSPYYNIHLFDFPGHGGRETGKEFSIRHFAASLQEYIEQNGLSGVGVFGYSMGGYVALWLAASKPGLISRISTLATKFDWTGEIAAREIRMLQPEVIEQKLPAFADTLRKRHLPGDWKQVLASTATMMEELGTHNPLDASALASVDIPVLVLLGDRDKMVTVEETLQAFRRLPQAQLGILPATPHPVEQVNTALLVAHLRQFFDY